jgi:hypothetical protein
MEETPQKREALPDFGIWFTNSPFFHIQNCMTRRAAGDIKQISHFISIHSQYFEIPWRMAIVMHIGLWKVVPDFPQSENSKVALWQRTGLRLHFISDLEQMAIDLRIVLTPPKSSETQ